MANKPIGIGMHREDATGDQPGLAEISKQQAGIKTLLTVHRLDISTSGLILFAKNSLTAAELSQLFADHKIEKNYVAIAKGKPKKKQGWIKGDMNKGRNGSWLLLRTSDNPAITSFQSFAVPESPGQRVYLLQPRTGKTHQLRVAMKSLGTPILGDKRYKGEQSDRCYLHAFELKFTWQNKLHHYQALPEQGAWPDFNNILLSH